MSDFDKPIGRAWRRMRAQRFLSALVWCLGAALLAVAVALVVENATGRRIPGPAWAPFAVAAGMGVAVAALIAGLTGPSRVDAAVAIDRKFQLNERLSTALTLPGELRETQAGRALIADAIRHVGGLDIPTQFGVALPRRSWVTAASAALAVGMLFLPDLAQKTASGKGSTASVSDPIKKEVVAKQAAALKKATQAQRKELDKNAQTQTDAILAKIEKAADDLAKSPPQQKDKAMVELNKLTDQLKERQKQIGSAEQISKQLQQMKSLASQGPADDFAKEVTKGDFAKAAEQIKQLKEKLATGKMSEAEKKALKDQIGEMQKQMEKLANLDQRKKQLDEALKNGALSKEQHEQQMAKLQEQAKDLAKLQKLANQLAGAQDALQKGDMKKAAEQMGMGQKQLEQLAEQAKELETLSQAMADIQDAKNGMANDGTNQLGSAEDGMNGLGMGRRPGNGNGMGRGRGQGDRPEAPDDVRSYNTQTKSQIQKGSAIVVGDGPKGKQFKGLSIIEVQGETEAAGAAAAEALSNQKVPNSVRKHVSGYFDQVRKGN